MKTAIIADIRANLHALDAVLADAVRRGVTRFLCLGDVVGYGPHPQVCVEKLRFLNIPTVLGNHDKWATMNPGYGSTIPGIDLAREQLTVADTCWLRKLPLIIKMPGYAFTHASFHALGAWECVDNADSASLSFGCLTGAVGFLGHTHIPGIWRASDMQWIEPPIDCPYQLASGERYLINPGSVGKYQYTFQGRPDGRAQYLIFDDQEKRITFHRVKFNKEAYVRAMLKTGLYVKGKRHITYRKFPA